MSEYEKKHLETFNKVSGTYVIYRYRVSILQIGSQSPLLGGKMAEVKHCRDKGLL